MNDEPLLQVEELHKQYGAVQAVQGLDLSLARGEVLGLLGTNGAGKTTTMAILAGVLAPTSGSVRIAGHDLALAPLAAKAQLGYLPETPPLFPELTVDEYLRHCAVLRGVPRQRVAATLARVKERCALTQCGPRLLGNLSKGFRQRAGIAQAIIHEPALVILDEPTSGLDPVQLHEIRALIRELGDDHAVVFSTHLLPEVQQLCDRVQVIHQGRAAMSAAIGALPGADNAYRVRAIDAHETAVAPATIQTLGMVDAVTANSDGSMQVCLRDEPQALARFSRACSERNWALLELTPQRASLEDWFLATARADPGDAALADTTRQSQ